MLTIHNAELVASPHCELMGSFVFAVWLEPATQLLLLVSIRSSAGRLSLFQRLFYNSDRRTTGQPRNRPMAERDLRN